MSTVYAATVPARIADYFGLTARPARADHPLIAEVFTDRWRPYPTRKRVSTNALRQLRGDGATSVAIDYQGRRADFTIREALSTLTTVPSYVRGAQVQPDGTAAKWSA